MAKALVLNTARTLNAVKVIIGDPDAGSDGRTWTQGDSRTRVISTDNVNCIVRLEFRSAVDGEWMILGHVRKGRGGFSLSKLATMCRSWGLAVTPREMYRVNLVRGADGIYYLYSLRSGQMVRNIPAHLQGIADATYRGEIEQELFIDALKHDTEILG